MGGYPPGRFVAVHDGHVEVGAQNVDARVFRKALERVHAARRRHHFATEVLQHVRGNFQNERIVIENQYGSPCRYPTRSEGCPFRSPSGAKSCPISA